MKHERYAKKTGRLHYSRALIVIVVIAILAAISIVAYTGIQQRARDSKRVSDIAQIKKALLAYDAVHGGVVRPNIPGYQRPAGEPPLADWDASTSARWLVFLRSSHGEMPVDPINSAPHVTSPSNASNRLYAYYCYPAGHDSAFPDPASAVLRYNTDAGVNRSERIRVSSCMTTIPSTP